MARLRDATSPDPRMAADQNDPVRVRGDALSDAAFVAKRAAEVLIEQDVARRRLGATCAGAAGLLAAVLGALALTGWARPDLLIGLATLAALVPTVHAFANVGGGATQRVQDAAYQRGFCHGLAIHAKRLGEAVGSTDTRGLELPPAAVLGDQLEMLYRDLDRARQRLRAAGSTPEARTTTNRMHERLVPASTDTLLTAIDGRRYPVRIAEVSQSGVTLKGNLPRLSPNEEIQVGSRRARVVKAAAAEATLRFINPILPSEFTGRLVL